MENCPHPTSPRRSSRATLPGGPSGATLLVFTLGARRESRRRRLLPPAQKVIEDSLHQACLDAALAAGRAAGFRLEVSSPQGLDLPADVDRRPQPGADFGSRLEGVVEAAIAEQGAPTVLVGSDVPDLRARHLRRTLEALAEDPDRVVIGPSPDGGFYLLAAARPFGGLLSRVRWRCRETLRSLVAALRDQGRPVVMLPSLADLDRRADLERWLATSTATGATALRGLIDRLAAILADLRRAWFPAILPGSPHRGAGARNLRGPPLPA